jgi:hypothetical protein
MHFILCCVSYVPKQTLVTTAVTSGQGVTAPLILPSTVYYISSTICLPYLRFCLAVSLTSCSEFIYF